MIGIIIKTVFAVVCFAIAWFFFRLPDIERRWEEERIERYKQIQKRLQQEAEQIKNNSNNKKE